MRFGDVVERRFDQTTPVQNFLEDGPARRVALKSRAESEESCPQEERKLHPQEEKDARQGGREGRKGWGKGSKNKGKGKGGGKSKKEGKMKTWHPRSGRHMKAQRKGQPKGFGRQ